MQYTQKEDSDHLRTFYVDMGPALNRSGLEIVLKVPIRSVRDWLSGKRGFPDAHRHKVEAWARRYGYNKKIQYDSIV